jgi:hypothetical protein
MNMRSLTASLSSRARMLFYFDLNKLGIVTFQEQIDNVLRKLL